MAQIVSGTLFTFDMDNLAATSANAVGITSMTMSVGPENQGVFTTGGAGWQYCVRTAQSGNGTISQVVDAEGLLGAVISPGDLADIVYRIAASGAVIDDFAALASDIAVTGRIRLGKFAYEVQLSGEAQTCNVDFMSHGPLASTGDAF